MKKRKLSCPMIKENNSSSFFFHKWAFEKRCCQHFVSFLLPLFEMAPDMQLDLRLLLPPFLFLLPTSSSLLESRGPLGPKRGRGGGGRLSLPFSTSFPLQHFSSSSSSGKRGGDSFFPPSNSQTGKGEVKLPSPSPLPSTHLRSPKKLQRDFKKGGVGGWRRWPLEGGGGGGNPLLAPHFSPGFSLPQKKREGKKLSNFWIESVEEGGREGPQRRRREKDKKRGLSEKKRGEIEVGIHAP